jgi:NADPH:quinone reductase-like Zn-dependent oxidoreductase
MNANRVRVRRPQEGSMRRGILKVADRNLCFRKMHLPKQVPDAPLPAERKELLLLLNGSCNLGSFIDPHSMPRNVGRKAHPADEREEAQGKQEWADCEQFENHAELSSSPGLVSPQIYCREHLLPSLIASFAIPCEAPDMKRYCLAPASDGPRELSIIEAPMPEPQAGEVVVRLEAASLNYRDILVRSGQSASGGTDPVVPLSDGAGVISALGSDVTGWKIGDRVALTFFREWEDGPFEMRYHQAARGGSCDGVLSEWVVAPSHSIVRLPASYSTTEGATLPCAAVTAWHALMERGRPVGPGDKVLCLGTGGVSIFALQIALAAGAEVIVTSSSDAKLARARSMGASHTINYREQPEWGKVINGFTDGLGVSHVVEVGGAGTIGQSMIAVGAGGSIALIGVLTGFAPPQASLFPLVTKNVDLHGIYVGHRTMFERLAAFLEQHAIRPVIDAIYPFVEAPSAYQHLSSGSHLGKVVISMP